jgi:uncharacterized delta-60 repeat protein
MYMVVGIVAMLLASGAWGAQQANAVGVAATAGDLDPTFGSGGKVTTNFFGSTDGASAIAMQPDGKIIVAGVSFNPITFDDFALARYNPDGSLDTSFGIGGKVNTDFFGLGDEALAVAIQPDRKIIAAGRVTNLITFADFGITRYNADGSLDTSFGVGGTVTTDFFSNSGDIASGIAVQPDGRIIVSGYIFTPFEIADFALARYNRDGSLDTSFGTGGKVTTDFLRDFDAAFAITIQADGKIILAGVANRLFSTTTDEYFALARYNPDGNLDTSFGTGGKVTTDFFGFSFARGIALQSNGRIVAAGAAFRSPPTFTQDFALARYMPDGTLDTSFGSGGKITTDFFGLGDEAFAVSLQTDAKIITAGRVFNLPTLDLPELSDFGLARYNPDGSLDASFGTGGKVTTNFFGLNDEARALTIQRDSRVFAGGKAFRVAFFPVASEFALARYQTDIQPDFTLSFDQPTVNAVLGTKVRVTININRIGGFSGDVTLTPPEPAMGIKPKPSSPITTMETSVKLKLKITASASPGEHELIFTGTDNSGRVRTATLKVLVE